MGLKVGDVFEHALAPAGATPPGSSPASGEGARVILPVVIRGSGGQSAALMPGTLVGLRSDVAGVSAAWILANLGSDVPASWTVTPLSEVGGS